MHLRALPFVLALAASLTARAQPPSYMNFEAGPVRPLAMSADGARLFVVNTPDDRLEILDLTGARPAVIASVPVGLSPVAVAVESASRVWVVNHLSDSVSIVDVSASPPRVVRTLLVGDEPNDVVFGGPGGRRAFITAARRGQNHPVPRGDYATEGIGRADVWVFNGDALGAPLGGTPLTIITLFGDSPRALAVSADGSRVYAAVFLSGNQTTTVSEGVVCDGLAIALSPCATGPGGLPPPFTNHAGIPAPEVGLIVRYDPSLGIWADELGRDWSTGVRFDLPDEDVFEIDANMTPPAPTTRTFAGVGTVNYAMAVNPVSGALYVSNTEAHNEVRFEGPGTFVREMGLRGDGPYSVRGHLHEARVTVIDGTTVTPRHLNPHIPYGASFTPEGTRERSIATPLGMAVSADGEQLYVAAYGSSAIGVVATDGLASGTIDTSATRLISLDAGPVGPTGMVLDETRGRMYVATRFDNAVRTVDLESRAVLGTALMHTPEPEATITGRPMLYDARFTSTNGEASCGSCHVFGDLDGLAWDLGNPDDDELDNPNPIGPIGTAVPFHPMKGPMTTQSLRGMADHGAMHWRGDRSGGNGTSNDPLDELDGFRQFNGAFDGLLGREEGPLRADEMERFAQFALGIVYPPNPIRQLDNQLREDEARGRAIYFEREAIDTVSTCNGCHEVQRAQGFFGGNGEFTFENEPQHFKVAHLRNAYRKIGMFGMPAVQFFLRGSNEHLGPQVRGFGFLHDGSTDTLHRFLRASVFTFGTTTERTDVEAFVMAFETNLAPIVGQQVTLDPSSDANVEQRIDLFIARAGQTLVWPHGPAVPECDLVVRGVVSGVARGWLLGADGMFHADVAGETIADDDLRAIGRAGSLTYTCAPPGSGVRMAQDRDEDGVLDGDDSDPAARAPIAIPNPTLPGRPMPMVDAGMPEMDGGAADAGMTETPDGCGCRASSRGHGGLLPLLGLVLLALRRRRR
jgi:MYXO-CTERM domain-containing protein